VQRFKDHLRFAVCFAGLGYLMLWPLAASGRGGSLFGAAFLCGGGAPHFLEALCGSAHPLTLSPALHAMGFLSMLAALTCLSLRLLRRRPRRRRDHAAPAVVVSAPLIAPALPKLPPRPAVTPRREFGLRGSKPAAPASDMA
jgi:hypothetical protein